MAPELFDGNAGDEATDQFALGVTLCRLFSGSFPYGEAEAFSRPRFGKPKPPSASRDDLPAWLDDIILRAVAASPNRSEEHTSELQSLMRISYAVFCLKKKTLPTVQNTKDKY